MVELMIVGLDGMLEAHGSDFVVVKVGGVSLKVFVPTSTLAVAGSPGDRVRLRTHLQVREDNLSLFGFASAEELEIFEMALTVSGVGPRLALSLLSALNPSRLVEAVCSEDVQTLTGVPGVGKKTASHLILELKDKLSKKRIGVPLAASSAGDNEVIAALRSLGYSSNEAAMALAAVPNNKKLSLEEKVRLALQGMGKR